MWGPWRSQVQDSWLGLHSDFPAVLICTCHGAESTPADCAQLPWDPPDVGLNLHPRTKVPHFCCAPAVWDPMTGSRDLWPQLWIILSPGGTSPCQHRPLGSTEVQGIWIVPCRPSRGQGKQPPAHSLLAPGQCHLGSSPKDKARCHQPPHDIWC